MSVDRVRALEKLFAYGLNTSQCQLQQIEQDLAEFEARYALSSGAFYARSRRGELGDAMGFVECASLVQMARRVRGAECARWPSSTKL